MKASNIARMYLLLASQGVVVIKSIASLLSGILMLPVAHEPP